jgi:hypothetical protein
MCETDETIEEWCQQWGGTWGEHPDFPVSLWQHDVADGNTRQGYWEWVENMLDNNPERAAL